MYFVHVYIYIYIFFLKNPKKKSNFPNLSKKKKKKKEKKKKKFQMRKCLDWGIRPLSHLKKDFWTRGIGLPSDFFKNAHFFFQIFQDSLKSSFL